MTRYRRNIGLNYLYSLLMNLNLTHGLWMIYLTGMGFPLVQLGLLEGIYHITGFLMEIPTGMVADLWGRKASRIAGRLVWCSSVALMYFPHSFWLQALGFSLCALGNNLESGAGDALVYDSLLLDGKQEEFVKVSGRQEFLYEIAAIAAYLVGGYLAMSSWLAVFGFSFLSALAAAVVAFWFKEPIINRQQAAGVREQQREKFRFSTMPVALHQQVRDSFSALRSQRRIGLLMICSELLFTFVVSMYFYLQVHWKESGISEWEISVVFATYSVLSGAGALLTNRIKRRFHEHRVLLILPLIIIAFIWGIAASNWQILSYIAIGSVAGIFNVLVSNYVNRLIPSAQRATLLSLQSMAFSTFMVVVFPLIGYLASTFSIRFAFIAVAMCATLLYLPYGRYMMQLASQESAGSSKA